MRTIVIRCRKQASGLRWKHAHAETKCEVKALNELILEIMPLNHAESRQGLFSNFEHEFCADRLATVTDSCDQKKKQMTQDLEM
jgi:hypothetical protein